MPAPLRGHPASDVNGLRLVQAISITVPANLPSLSMLFLSTRYAVRIVLYNNVVPCMAKREALRDTGDLQLRVSSPFSTLSACTHSHPAKRTIHSTLLMITIAKHFSFATSQFSVPGETPAMVVRTGVLVLLNIYSVVAMLTLVRWRVDWCVGTWRVATNHDSLSRQLCVHMGHKRDRHAPYQLQRSRTECYLLVLALPLWHLFLGTRSFYLFYSKLSSRTHQTSQTWEVPPTL